MILKKMITQIPEKCKPEFIQSLQTENLKHTMIGTAAFIAIEMVVAFFIEDFLSPTFLLSIGLILYALLFLPMIYFTYKRIDKLPFSWVQSIQIMFLLGLILGGVLWTVMEQQGFSSASTYICTIIAIAAFISFTPVEGAFLYSIAFLLFILILPRYQHNVDAVQTLTVNSFLMSILAWLLNSMIFQGKVTAYQHRKTIEEKTLELERINKELEEKNKELKEMSIRDSLTSLLNHKNSLKRLKEEVERAKRISYPLCVAMIDLDNFKHINDEHGHQTGDDVLTIVAKILKETCRTTDIIGRYGGEEFIIIMPDTGADDAGLLIKRIQKRILEEEFEKGIHITFSCGISELNGESVHGIVRSSDLMLYRAKKKGKNRVEIRKSAHHA
ncbi:GGDEF domain-containing protein [Sinanaerobacter chloroacetimidivorans]|uniref:Diguanylate cyclase n=1 Tax=Sinanaerobacter chloroacetimidivorans TaxID=2818044 RepID=A0A8J7W5Q2_9FIRM|nr:GGDEF domain-containing protein [Sinanaerobacter chloroacetimidivorans]MBR0599685.1 diguanylate cyclase [Sinanaerobacter chloroacetimidivorans]